MTADAVEPTVPEEAIEAAARAQYAMNGVPLEGGGFDDAPESVRDDYRIEARAALAAAVPVIEKQLRARLADEIEAFGAMQQELAAGGILQAAATVAQVWLAAARIVRGEQP